MPLAASKRVSPQKMRPETSPNFGDTNRREHAEFVDRRTRHFDFNDQIGSRIHQQIDLAFFSNDRLVANVIGLIGLKATLQINRN